MGSLGPICSIATAGVSARRALATQDGVGNREAGPGFQRHSAPLSLESLQLLSSRLRAGAGLLTALAEASVHLCSPRGGSSPPERSFLLSAVDLLLCTAARLLCCPGASPAWPPQPGQLSLLGLLPWPGEGGASKPVAGRGRAAATSPPCGVGPGSGRRDWVEERRHVSQGEHGCSQLALGTCKVRCFRAGVFRGAIRESAESWLLTRGN